MLLRAEDLDAMPTLFYCYLATRVLLVRWERSNKWHRTSNRSSLVMSNLT